MLEIELKKKFTKDLKKHILNQKIELEVFDLVVENLGNQIPLDKRFKDHALSGTYKGCRECHIKPNVLLVYRVKNNVLTLVRLGSHSELFCKPPTQLIMFKPIAHQLPSLFLGIKFRVKTPLTLFYS
ncbi:type II toxin-antitoxin system YafQ family toxin [Helicobacter pylori]|nr:type II toxin-antitoxin system YafQ family toxin [Helicobacter pylori]